MDRHNYRVRRGDRSNTMAARALGVEDSDSLTTVFHHDTYIGPHDHAIMTFHDSRDPDRLAAVATGTEGDHTKRATVATMTRKEWETAYHRAEERTRPAHAASNATFVSALMKELGVARPGFFNFGDVSPHREGEYSDNPSDELQPRAPGRIKSAAADPKAKTAAPKPRAHQGDER
jgi:hypothetical protein